MSKKIRMITCHDVYNVGASLQAYSLQEYLKQKLGDVKIIDYKPDYLSHHYKFTYVSNPKYRKNFLLKLAYIILKFPSNLKSRGRKKVFDKFTKKRLQKTERFNSFEELIKNEEIKNGTFADVFIAGSDQIWNTKFQNGKDPSFYLNFTNKGVKAAYAPSFATEKIEDGYEDFVRESLNNFDFISVRERSGLKILESLGINNATVVVDPVFLLDKERFEELILDANVELKVEEKYILLYDFDNSKEVEIFSKRLKEEKNLKIYSIFKNEYADKYIKNVGPNEFLKLIKNAEYVVSNSFHATAFSIIFKKEFFVLQRQEGINTRMKDLLSSLCLSERYITDVSVNRQAKIDYKAPYERLNEQINNSKKYLDLSLGED